MTNNATDTALAALANDIAPDARSLMLTAARAIVSTVVAAEAALGDSAKAWGHNLFRLCYPTDGSTASDMNALIGDTKTVADWASLAATDAGRKVKGRMEVYFSNARLVAETFGTMSDDARRDILAGSSSIHYVAGQLRKAKADAEKAAKKEAARVAAEKAADEAKANANDSKSEPLTEAKPDLLAAIAAFRAAFDASDDDTLRIVAEDMQSLMDAINDRYSPIVAADMPDSIAA